MGRPALKREVVAYIIDHYGLALARACKLIRQVRSTQYVRSRKDPKLSLRQRLRELAHVCTRTEPAGRRPERPRLMGDAKQVIEAWRLDYDENRPHASLALARSCKFPPFWTIHQRSIRGSCGWNG